MMTLFSVCGKMDAPEGVWKSMHDFMNGSSEVEGKSGWS